MSFGKRTFEPKSHPSASAGRRTVSSSASDVPAKYEVAVRAQHSRSVILASLLAAICVAVAWIGYQQFLPGFTTADPANDSDKILIGPRPPNLALLKTKGATAWEAHGCRYGDPDAAMDAYKKNPFRRGDGFGSLPAEIFKDHAEFLECIAQSEARPLCGAEVRAAFASDANKFMQDYALIAPNTVAFQAGSQDDNTIANMMRELSNAHPELGDQMVAPRDTMVAARQRVVETLREAAVQGLISSGDFGYFAHSEIKSILSATPATRPSCK